MPSHGIVLPEQVGNSIYAELTRNFRVSFLAAKKALGDRHPLTVACLHASGFPGERMSARMVWEQFSKLPLPDRTELLQAIRSQLW